MKYITTKIMCGLIAAITVGSMASPALGQSDETEPGDGDEAVEEPPPPPPPPPPPEQQVVTPEDGAAPQTDHQVPGEESPPVEPEPTRPTYDGESSKVHVREPSSPDGKSRGTNAPAGNAKREPMKKVHVPVTKEQRAEICRQNEGKLISFYSDVYLVKGCKRLPLMSEDIYEQTRLGRQIQDVKRIVIEALPEGPSYRSHVAGSQFRGCKELEGRYITFKFGDIYVVKNCEKKVFLDWASFENHRGGISSAKATIYSVSWDEFSRLKEGRPMPSVILDEYRDILNGHRQVDVIPLDEACEGINGRMVSYYSRIYKIEKCHKREVNGTQFTKDLGSEPARLIEMTSEQWLSLPDGPPIGGKKEEAKPSAEIAR